MTIRSAAAQLMLALIGLASVPGFAEPRVVTYSDRSVSIEATDAEGAAAHALADAECKKRGLSATNLGRPQPSYLFFACEQAPSWLLTVRGNSFIVRAPVSAVEEVTAFATEHCRRNAYSSARKLAQPTAIYPDHIFICEK
jgi:hypothetical protein